jgi:hypothetical protein
VREKQKKERGEPVGETQRREREERQMERVRDRRST